MHEMLGSSDRPGPAAAGRVHAEDDLKQMRPQRPAELDKLNMWVGKWEGTDEHKMMGVAETLKSTGTSEVSWDDTGWYLIEKADYQMGEMGKMKMCARWAYDPKAKKYRVWMFDDWGQQGVGTAKYVEKDRKWYFTARSKGTLGSTFGRGCAKFVDDNTIEMTWSEWASWDIFRLFKFMEMTGTSKRK